MASEELEDMGLNTCDDCGVISEEVESTYCPYSEDIHNEKVDAFLCPSCYHERCMDI